jgi:hypothetical protein
MHSTLLLGETPLRLMQPQLNGAGIHLFKGGLEIVRIHDSFLSGNFRPTSVFAAVIVEHIAQHSLAVTLA